MKILNKTTCFTLFVTFICLTNTSFALIKLNINVTHKTIVNDGITLINELHSAETAEEGKYIDLAMKLGLHIKIKADFLKEIKSYGPMPYVGISGSIIDINGHTLHIFDTSKSKGLIGEKIDLFYQTPDKQMIEINIVPEIK